MVTTSGPDGSFAFDAPRGMLRLSAAVAGHSQVFGEMSPFANMGAGVATGPDQDTAHLVFRWFRPSVIAGRVVDDHGEPVENARVQLFYSGVVEGRARIVPLQEETSTDDRGEYRIWDIPGATYYVMVMAQPWYENPGVARPGQSQAPTAYQAAYYPGTTDVTRAAPLTVQPGAEARADFSLTAVGTGKITADCDDDESEVLPFHHHRSVVIKVTVRGIGGTERVVSSLPSVCSMPVSGVPPGHYLLRMSSLVGANPATAQRWVDVGAGDLAVSFSLHPAPVISGKVTLKNGGTRPSGLLAGLLRELDDWSVKGEVGADGSFSFPRIEPGRYRISVSGAGYHAETVRVGDSALPEGVVNIEDGAETRFSIVASNESGRLKGFATRNDQPVVNMLVVAVPRDPTSAYSSQVYQTDSDGSFDWLTLPAGDYLLFAVDDPTIAYADAETIKPYLPHAKPIRIEAGKVYEERVPVQAVAK